MVFILFNDLNPEYLFALNISQEKNGIPLANNTWFRLKKNYECVLFFGEPW